MNIPVAATLFAHIDNTLKLILNSNVSNMMLALGGIFGTFWLLKFTIRGFFWLKFGLTQVFEDVIVEISKMAIICGLAFNVTWYVATIVPFVTNAAASIGGILSGQDGSQVNQIDSMVESFITTFIAMIKAMKFDMWDIDFSALIASWFSLTFFALGMGLFLLVCISTIIVIKVASTLMLVLGPLFIAFALFDSTRQWFWGWVSLLAGFMLTQIMFSVMLAIEIAFVNSTIIVNGKIDPSMSGIITMSLFFFVLLILVVEIPSYAASIMGGTPVGGGIGALAGKATGLRTATSLTKLVGSKVGKNKIT